MARQFRGAVGTAVVVEGSNATDMRAGYLRKNGVPDEQNANVTEYFDIAPHPNGGPVLLVATFVTDPQYLQQPFIVSSQFKKEDGPSTWEPTPWPADNSLDIPQPWLSSRAGPLPRRRGLRVPGPRETMRCLRGTVFLWTLRGFRSAKRDAPDPC